MDGRGSRRRGRHAYTEHAATIAAAAAVTLALAWLVVDLNRRIFVAWPALDATRVSSTPFYLIWAAIAAALSVAWPLVARTPWRVHRPRSRGDWIAVAVAVGGTAFLYQNALAKALGGRLHAPPSALAWFAGGLFGPFVEEWLFRGLLYEIVRVSHPARGHASAIVVSSVVFGLWHLSFEGFGAEALRMAVVHAIFGALMAVLRWRLGGLLPGALLHAAGNSLAILT